MEKLYIKNMVCNRCIMVVDSEFEKMGIKPLRTDLGEVTLAGTLEADKKKLLDARLQELGFALIDDRKSRLIEKIKTLIIDLVQVQNCRLDTNLSDYLSNQLNHDYTYMTNLFSEVEGTTIEKYYIAQKIEKVKELLVYDEMSLSEIAYHLNYSSVSHLSNQFKKVTGLTPSHFKNIRDDKRKPLDEV